MLLRFVVTNFRSFKETQSLTMSVAGSMSEQPNNIFTFPMTEGRSASKYALLKSAAIPHSNQACRNTS